MTGEPSSTETTGLAPGALVAGRYRLLRVIGTGGMGAVYECETPEGKRLALKALYASHDWNQSQQRARFLREAAVTASLTHPNIVPVVDHGIDEATTTPYLVMPLLAGEDLNTAIQRLGAIEPDVALRLFIQACLGLEAAHNAGVIHRDIKPSNLFLETGPAGTLTLKVCDFGLAKAFVEADSLTNTGAFLGTPHYVSPEQATDAKRVDARSDVWSLAMTLYHALAGVPAYGHIDNVVGLIFELTAGRVRPLQDVAPWIDPRLARVVHGALLRDRDARCPSVHELERALATILGDEGNLTALTESALRAAPDDLRTRVAEHAELPATWRDAVPAVDDGDDARLLVGTTLGGRYKLERVIGRGGMGAIYAATTGDGAEVALKVMRPELARRSRDAMRRFVREARSAQAIHSDHVARVVEAGTDDKAGVPYIVMELLRGTDLGRLMKDKGPLEAKAILPVFVQACRGLAAAHALGIVHRDIKPANIFLHQSTAGEITTKLCDFGVAKQTFPGEIEDATTDLTRTGGMLGSPIYMSPEQAQNAKNVDHRTDVYSLAITLHQALSGQRPWQGCTTMGELILAICTREVVSLQEIAPWIEPALAQVVHRAVRRNIAERYASAEAFAAALEPFASSSAAIRLDSLLPVSDAQRAISQPPAFAASLAGSSSDGRSETTRGGRSWWTRGRIAAGVILITGCVAGGTALVAARNSAKAPPTPTTLSAAATPPPGVAVHEPPVQVTVAVSPPSAKVSVRGEHRELVGGFLPLEGKPGERFVVTLEQDGVHKDFFVAITSDATAVPSALELPALPSRPPLAPDAGSAPAASVRVAVGGRAATPAAVAAAKSGASAAPDPAPPPPASAALPELKTKW